MKINMQKSSEPNISVNDVTRISRGAVFNGSIVSVADIRIDGTVIGSVLSEGKIVVGEQAVISGRVYCNNLDFWGRMDGDIYVKDTLSFKNTAVISGNIHVHKFQVELGAQLNGSCKMISEKEYDDLAGKIRQSQEKIPARAAVPAATAAPSSSAPSK